MYRTASVVAKAVVAPMPALFTLALIVGPHAFGQQPLTNPSTSSLHAAPGAIPAQPPQAAPVQTHNDQQQVQVNFSPWAKYCANGPKEPTSGIMAKKVCFTAADGHLPSGQKLVIVLLIEPEGTDTKLLRVTLPLGVALIPGARFVVDENEPMIAPFVACLTKSGCMADYKADDDLIEKMKEGRSLAIQAFDKGKPIRFTLPLTEFAKAHDGPAGDSAGLNELPSGVSRQSYE